jgi:hypothetical protein
MSSIRKLLPILLVYMFVSNGHISEQFASLATCQKAYTDTTKLANVEAHGLKTSTPNRACWTDDVSAIIPSKPIITATTKPTPTPVEISK